MSAKHPYWCHVPSGSTRTVLQALEDAHIRSYTTAMMSSHDALLHSEETIVELVDFGTGWKYQSYHVSEIDQLEQEFELKFDRMLAYLDYLASE